MCGITGFFSPSGVVNKSELQEMTSSLLHRGPDAGGCFFDEEVGLGHRRLSILDLSDAANQPMFSQNKRFVLVYNGEVYNFLELIAPLDILLRTAGDTEVVVEAFAKWGSRAIPMFNGMFAGAIYDTVEKILWVFRDRMGIKPLYYYWDGVNFLFSSELKALLKVDKVRDEATINKEALNLYLYLGYIPEPHTIYNNIYKFPAGNILKITKDDFSFECYWKLEDQIEKKTLTDEVKAKDQLKKLLFSSVQYRLVSDVPFGTFLSGGIDSSLVTAVAQALHTEPIKTFTIGFKDSAYNEAEHARKIAEYLKTDHHEFMVSSNDAFELIDTLLDSYDEPFADSSAIPTMLVSKLARNHVTMTLSGDGGDESYLGYGSYTWARRFSNPFFRGVRLPAAGIFSLMNNRYRRAASMLYFQSEDRIKSHIFSQEQYNFTQRELLKLLPKEMQADINLKENFTNLNRTLNPEEEQALFDLKYYLKDDLLVKVDRASMKYSLESRVPLLDHRLIRFALNISPELKIRNGVYKYLLKEVLYEMVPKEYFDRPKWGFAIPLIHWLKNDLKYLIDKYLNEKTILQCGLVNYDYVNQMLISFQVKNRDHLYNRLWLLIILHKWYLEKHLPVVKHQSAILN